MLATRKEGAMHSAALKRLRSGLSNEKGQGLVEYGLIIGVISVACITVMATVLRPAIGNLFTSIGDLLAAL
jgi:pilus assembly protein Flp/PilA